jgi:DNA end-binding protein Ku
VELADIDPVYFEHPYYLVPDKEAAKAYALLVETMAAQEKVAIGRFVMRSKEHHVAIRSVEGVLVVETMRYADEVVDPVELDGWPSDDVEISKKERTMAAQLVESLTADFDPDKYHDEYREELLALIEAKAAGEEVVIDPVSPEPSKVVDIMEALQESLDRTKRRRAKAGGKKRGGRKTA